MKPIHIPIERICPDYVSKWMQRGNIIGNTLPLIMRQPTVKLHL